MSLKKAAAENNGNSSGNVSNGRSAKSTFGNNSGKKCVVKKMNVFGIGYLEYPIMLADSTKLFK
jgi:hypothetical protein